MNPPNRKRISVRDVAVAAQTSVATVSRVLNNTGYFAEGTRARVLKAAEDLNYHPSLRAKGLRQKRSYTIGLLIPNLLNAYYTALADAISQLLTKAGYQLLLSSTRDDPVLEQATLRQLIGHDVDGLLWVPTMGDKKTVDILLSQNIPSVSIVRRVDGDRLDTIVFEDLAGSYAAVHYLIQLGHRRIGFIGGDISYNSNNDRWQGYLKALKEAGIEVEEGLVKIGSARDTWGSIATDELLRRSEPPTAIFAASNAIIPGVMKWLLQHEVQIPEEMSLICFDDLDWFTFSNPPISAISISHERIAEAAVDLLLQRIEGPEVSKRPPIFMNISFKLLLRKSAAAPRQAPPHWK
jgi:LacI family transcriptional regulator